MDQDMNIDVEIDSPKDSGVADVGMSTDMSEQERRGRTMLSDRLNAHTQTVANMTAISICPQGNLTVCRLEGPAGGGVEPVQWSSKPVKRASVAVVTTRALGPVQAVWEQEFLSITMRPDWTYCIGFDGRSMAVFGQPICGQDYIYRERSISLTGIQKYRVRLLTK